MNNNNMPSIITVFQAQCQALYLHYLIYFFTMAPEKYYNHYFQSTEDKTQV